MLITLSFYFKMEKDAFPFLYFALVPRKPFVIYKQLRIGNNSTLKSTGTIMVEVEA